MDYSKWQRSTMTGHGSICLPSRCQRDGRESAVKSLASKASPHIVSEWSRKKNKPASSTAACRSDKNHDKKVEEPGGRLMLPCNKPAASALHTRCQRLEQDNAAMLQRIINMEDRSMKSATQQLLQYDRAGSNVLAVQLWADHQIQDAQQDLEETRGKRQECLNDLGAQLRSCEEELKGAQEELQRLREYRDRGHSVAVLQAAGLERQLRKLNEIHQDQAADVEVLAETEIQKLLDRQNSVKEGALQSVVKHHMERLPLSLRRMCLQNQEMKLEIQAYQKMVADLEDEVLNLQRDEDSLRRSWKEETDTFCRDLLLNRPSCFPDEDVVLNIPRRYHLPL
ncbi:uncharacterized protein C20orf96 homolog [Hyperolius riggenbachi]|uniref:uncharacterized protein C20orf96 homolog n=1 Tax=Hyperolius riggenbachi TaxID=752182 RepID=UPI0035A2BE02